MDRIRPLHTALAALVLAAATFALYLPVGGHDFVDFDDGSYVTKNPDVLAGLTAEGVQWAFTRTHSSNWHPLTWMSHMLDVELFGLDAGRHHLVNAGLHALNAGLLLIALVALTRRMWPCVVVAALFAVHPLRVESVAWIAERKDVLSSTFFFLALWAYAAYARMPSPGRLGLVMGTMLLGLLAKPMLVTLPFLLVVLDRWPLGRRMPLGELLREKVPLFLLVVGSCIVTVIAQSLGEAIHSTESLPLDVRFANAFVAYVAYLARTFWPVGLAVFYPHPALVDPGTYEVFGSRVLLAAGLVLAISAVALQQRSARPWLLAGWLWFLGMLVPVIGIVQVGAQWMADRYAYLPLIGIYVALVWTVDGLLRGRAARAVGVVAGLAAAGALVPLTMRQIRTWEDTGTLFENAIAVTEGNYVAHVNLGFRKHLQGDLAAAEAHYEAALAIAPAMVDALSDLGGLRWQQEDYAAARELLDRAIAEDPGYSKAWLNLGLVLRDTGEPEAALEAFRSAVAAEPDSAEARIALAGLLRDQGRPGEAVPIVAEAVARSAQDRAARMALVEALMDADRDSEAVRHLRVLVRTDDPPPLALEHLAWIQATSSDPRLLSPVESLALAQRRGAMPPATWSARRVLAAALAANGRFDEAASVALEAAARAPSEEQAGLMQMQTRFRSGQTWSE